MRKRIFNKIIIIFISSIIFIFFSHVKAFYDISPIEITSDKLSLEETKANNSILPEKYNLKDSLQINVRNQQNTGFCWAFASSKVFETTEAKLNNKTTLNEYSPRHIAYSTSRYFNNNVENPTGFNKDVKDGANYFHALAYYTSGKGPVLETEMPFKNSVAKIDISEIQNKKVQAQIEEAIFFPSIFKTYSSNSVIYSDGKDKTYSEEEMKTYRDKIKTQIMEYGAVGTITYSPTNSTDSYFSNDLQSYYCNNTNLNSNHAVILVGWDDTYSKNNFKEGCKPINDGAYIALNSYGNFNGSGGYFYISYDDYFVETSIFGIQGISDVDYDNIYQYDELGMSSYLAYAYNDDNSYIKELYGANIFNKKTENTEKLTEIGLYMYTTNDVTIYVNSNGDDINIRNLQPVANARNLTEGYHVIKLENPITIGDTFSIIVKYSNNIVASIPLESKYSDTKYWDTVTANPGESFISFNGEQWSDLTKIENFDNTNICIKAFTVNDNENIEYIKNENWKIINIDNTNILTGIEENTTISELLSSTNYTANYTIKAYKDTTEINSGIATTGTIIKIYNNSNLVEEYTVVIYGDTNGDGKIASVDSLIIIKNKLGKEAFQNSVYEQAGRTTLDTRNSNLQPSSVDALAVIKNKLGKEKILQ